MEVEFLWRLSSCGGRVLVEVEFLVQVEFRWREAEAETHVYT